MIFIGRRIFYEIETGNVILDTGEKTGYVVPTTVEQDVDSFKALSERNRETFDYIELEYGQYSSDFLECNGYRVNIETKEIEFSYLDDNETSDTPVFQKSLSERLKEQEQAIAELSVYIATLGI